jgi:hypothetical protein
VHGTLVLSNECSACSVGIYFCTKQQTFNIVIFWVIRQYVAVGGYRCIGGTFCLRPLGTSEPSWKSGRLYWGEGDLPSIGMNVSAKRW